MGRYKHYQQLKCYMNNVSVGTLTHRQNNLSFQYDDSWLSSRLARPISLSLPLQSESHKGKQVYAYFENLLPDNVAVRKQIVDRLGANSTHPFDLLRAIGADCIGAISLIDEENPIPSSNRGYQKLNESEIATILRNTISDNSLGMDQDDDFRISLAGAQEKTALTLIDGQWYKPHGKLATTHILKLPIYSNRQFGPDLSDSVENEWFHLELFRNLGFDTATCSIVRFKAMKALSVERFDRRWKDDQLLRLPQEDLCQALGYVSGSKYEEHGGPGIKAIMDLLAQSSQPDIDRKTFMRSQVISWLIAATDAHAKNYSIFLKPNGFHLTPTYDVLSAFPYFGQGEIHAKKIKLAMALLGKNKQYRWNNIMRRHFISTAEKIGFDTQLMDSILDETKSLFPNALEKTIDSVPTGFPAHIIKATKNKALQKLKRI